MSEYQHAFTRLNPEGKILGATRDKHSFHLVDCAWSPEWAVCQCPKTKTPGINIDNKLVPVIQGFWKAGIETSECCQGRPEIEDHGGYISFKDSDSARQFHKAMSELDYEPWLGNDHNLSSFPPIYMALIGADWRLDPKSGKRLLISFTFKSEHLDDLIDMVSYAFPITE